MGRGQPGLYTEHRVILSLSMTRFEIPQRRPD